MVSAEPDVPDPDVRRPPPRWIKLVLMTFGVAVVVVVAIALAWARLLDSQHAAECERFVESRDENRSMWLWIGEQQANSPQGADFLAKLNAELDVRLPRLACDPSSNPIPVETTSPDNP